MVEQEVVEHKYLESIGSLHPTLRLKVGGALAYSAGWLYSGHATIYFEKHNH